MARQILIADDDPSFAQLLSIRLVRAGYDTLLMPEGINVMEQYLLRKPDLIILDLQLQSGTGMDVLKNLKGHPVTRQIPVIVVTGIWPHLENEVLRLGAAAFFRKPYDPEKLIERVSELLSPA